MNLTNLKNLPKEQTGVYTITHIDSKKKYIGSTNDCFRRRIFNHRARLRNNDHYNPHLQNAYNKYGEEAFEVKVVHKIMDYNSIIAMEQKMIEKYHDCWDKLYNSERDARRTIPWNKGRSDVYSKKTLEKMSQSAKNRNNADYVKAQQKKSIKSKMKSIGVYKIDGELIDIFDNIDLLLEANKNGDIIPDNNNRRFSKGKRSSNKLLKAGIYKVCRGDSKSYKGLVFKYEQQNG